MVVGSGCLTTHFGVGNDTFTANVFLFITERNWHLYRRNYTRNSFSDLLTVHLYVSLRFLYQNLPVLDSVSWIRSRWPEHGSCVIVVCLVHSRFVLDTYSSASLDAP